MSAHISTCRHISAHVAMSKFADTCQHADELQRVRIRDAESDGTCWHMSAHISTCRHISAHVGMFKCADTYQHGDKLQRVRIRDAESDGTCWHTSAYFGPYQHMSAHIGTCRYISAHLGMSTRADTCREWCHMLAHAGTCQQMVTHIDTYRHVHMCWHTSAWELGPMVGIRGA